MLNVTLRSIRFSENEEEPRYREHYRKYRTEGVDLPADCKINRTVMVALYRYLTAVSQRNRKESSLNQRAETVIRSVEHRYGIKLNYCRLMLCLDTMQELGLIRYEEEKALRIKLFRTEEKVDLCRAHDWDKISSADKG